MKKTFKIILIVIFMFLIIFCLLLIPSIINNNYQNNLIKRIENETNEKVYYLNEYNNYIIVKTSQEIIVYNTNYQEIYKENIDKISNLDYDIIYKKGSLMYEETILTKNKVTYNYYDIHTKDKIDSLEIEDNHD